MSGSQEPTPPGIRPLGGAQDDVREVAETEATRIRPYRADAYGEIAEYRPKSAAEVTKIHKARGQVRDRRVATVVGLGVITVVTLAAAATFLGMTFSTAPSAHEDAVRLLILIVGAVLGAVFGAEIGKDRD